MHMETANLISPLGVNTAVGLVSFESNTQPGAKTDPGIWQRDHQRENIRGVWRVRGGLAAFAHEPAHRTNTRPETKTEIKP